MHTRPMAPARASAPTGLTPVRPGTRRWRTRGATLLAAAGLALAGVPAVQAEDFGPFFINGFVKGEEVRVNNYCANCQRVPGASKDQVWGDALLPGTPYGAANVGTLLFQPWVGTRFDLGQGFKFEGLVSQRWRNGHEDFPGFYYEKNVAVSHENYGALRAGAMTTRAWALADYPYATNLSLSDAWASGGAGYGILTNAVRYTSRVLDVADGDLVLEATYDGGASGWTRNKPRFLELWARYQRGDLLLNAMFQDARNGTPMAFGHGVFTGLTPFPADDNKLGGSGQGIAMLMASYQYDSRLELNAGIRRNWWTGAYAVITVPGTYAQWNSMFNVDWGGSLNGVANPGYPAHSLDLSLGLRYRMGQWIASTGVVMMGKASTSNPSERGQSNWALIPTAKLQYDVGQGFSVYGFGGLVQYGRLGLSPMSMPANAAFTNVDSRVSRTGAWAGVGAVYVF